MSTLENQGKLVWHTLVDATAAVAGQTSLDYGHASAKADELALRGARYFSLRCFIQNAANEAATIDVFGWFGRARKGVLLARLLFTAGAETSTGNPFSAAGTGTGTYYEADHVRFERYGIARPVRILRGQSATGNGNTPADGSQMLVFMSSMGATSVTAECQSAGTAASILVGGRPEYHLPSIEYPGAWVVPQTQPVTTQNGGDGDEYAWTGDQSEVMIENLTAAPVHLKFNSATVTTTAYDLVIQSATRLKLTEPLYQLALRTTGAKAVGTHLVVLGRE